MNSPIPVRRFSRWKTQKREFILGRTSTASQKDSGVQLTNKVGTNSLHTTINKSFDKSNCEKVDTELQTASKLSQKISGKESERKSTKPAVSSSVQNSKQTTSVNQSSDQDEAVNSQPLRNKNSIGKSPPNHYDLPLFSSKKASSSSRSKKRLFNHCVSGTLDYESNPKSLPNSNIENSNDNLNFQNASNDKNAAENDKYSSFKNNSINSDESKISKTLNKCLDQGKLISNEVSTNEIVSPKSLCTLSNFLETSNAIKNGGRKESANNVEIKFKSSHKNTHTSTMETSKMNDLSLAASETTSNSFEQSFIKFIRSSDKDEDVSRRLRNRKSIRKPPPGHYPLEFLSSDRKKSSTSKLSKSIINANVTVAQDESQSKYLQNSNNKRSQASLTYKKTDKVASQAHSLDKKNDIKDSKVTKIECSNDGSTKSDGVVNSNMLKASTKKLETGDVSLAYDSLDTVTHRDPSLTISNSDSSTSTTLQKGERNKPDTTTKSNINHLEKDEKKSKAIVSSPKQGQNATNISIKQKKDLSASSLVHPSNDEAEAEGNRNLRNRNSIRKPLMNHYPLEFLSSSQMKSLYSITNEISGNREDKDSKVKRIRKAVVKRKYSLPKKKLKEAMENPIQEAPNIIAESTDHISQSLVVVDTLNTDAHKDSKDIWDNRLVDVSIAEGSDITHKYSQQLDDNVHGVYKAGRKRKLFSNDSEHEAESKISTNDQTSQHGEPHSNIESRINHTYDNEVLMKKQRDKSKPAAKKVARKLKSKSKKIRDDIKESEVFGRKADSGEKQVFKSRLTSLKAKDISTWMSSYQCFMRQLKSS